MEIIRAGSDWQARAIDLVTNTVASKHSRRIYRAALLRFFVWCEAERRPFNRETVTAYKAVLQDEGQKPQSINVHLAAIRGLAREAEANGLLDAGTAAGIQNVRSEKKLGQTAGNWLSLPQCRSLLLAPDQETLIGKRDRCVLALLVGCGLRREEASGLMIEQIQEREGRWCLIDVMGKGRRVRTVVLPTWAADMVWVWLDAAGHSTGPVLREVRRGRVSLVKLSAQGVYRIIEQYVSQLGFRCTPHDLRRTFAALSLKGGAGLREIQTALGHSSVTTTERYLGAVVLLDKPAGDFIKIKAGEV